MPPGNVLILTALYFEAAPIARRLHLRFTSRTTAAGATPTGLHVHLHIIGPAARHLPASLPADGPCHAVIMAGLAGGLAPGLNRADLVIDDQSLPTPNLPHPRGPIASLDSILSTPAEKAALHQSTGALVVDMENAAARSFAARHAVPFIGLRAISDTASETLNPACLRILDDHGFLHPTRLAATLLRHPGLLPAFWRLRTTSQITETLAREVARIVGHLTPTPVP
jgi:hypothetical protein